MRRRRWRRVGSGKSFPNTTATNDGFGVLSLECFNNNLDACLDSLRLIQSLPMHSKHSTVQVASREEDTTLLLFSRGLACLLMVAVAVGLPQTAAAQLASKSAQEWIKTLDSS